MQSSDATKTALALLHGRLMPKNGRVNDVAQQILEHVKLDGVDGEKERVIDVVLPLPNRAQVEKLVEACEQLPEDARTRRNYLAVDPKVGIDQFFDESGQAKPYSFELGYGKATVRITGIPEGDAAAPQAEGFRKRFATIAKQTGNAVPVAYIAPVEIEGRTLLDTGHHPDLLSHFGGLLKSVDAINAFEKHNAEKVKFSPDILLEGSGMTVTDGHQIGIGRDVFDRTSHYSKADIEHELTLTLPVPSHASNISPKGPLEHALRSPNEGRSR